jgi:serine/threonine protein kinase
MGKADTWAIGVILYFLLLGNLPFVGSNVSKLVKTVKKGKLKKVDQKEWCSDLKSLWDLITKNELHREDKTLKQKYAKKLKDSIHNLLIMDEISNYTSFL